MRRTHWFPVVEGLVAVGNVGVEGAQQPNGQQREEDDHPALQSSQHCVGHLSFDACQTQTFAPSRDRYIQQDKMTGPGLTLTSACASSPAGAARARQRACWGLAIHHPPPLPSSPGGIVALLSEPETELKVFALRKLDEIVNDFWAEIADSLQAL